jgi:hypothetical protein
MIILVWSLAMGWLLALTISANGTTPSSLSTGTVDVIPTKYQLGQTLYLENCSTCHIALPPAVFPSQTWRDILADSQHYGREIQTLVDPPRTLVWKYLSNFSRQQLADEGTPYFLNKSRYFRALHPGVKLPNPIKVDSCVSCHSRAQDYDFRKLSPEWDEKS